MKKQTNLDCKYQYHAIVSGYLKKSVTMQLYAELFKYMNIPHKYIPLELPRVNGGPDENGLLKVIQTFKASDNFHSLVISDPYKKSVYKHIDEYTLSAISTGAINLVYKKNGKMVGDNIDGLAFLHGYKQELNNTLSGASVFVYGAGGVSTAIACALLPKITRIGILGKSEVHARELVGRLKKICPAKHIVLYGKDDIIQLDQYDFIYNGTGLGKYSRFDESILETPITKNHILPSKKIFIDANYTPWTTRFLYQGIETDNSALNGFSHMISFVMFHLKQIYSDKEMEYADIKKVAYKFVITK